MARNASATDIFSCDDEAGPIAHGGDLAAARSLFPGAAEPFIDLSTGINPYHYPLPRLKAETWARLPAQADIAVLAAAAARAYGAPSPSHVVAAPGTQVLLPLVAGLVPAGSAAAIVSPTYGEFARAAALAGHRVSGIRELSAAADAQLVFVANPNNPDGRLFAARELLLLAARLRARRGIMVVDEAYMDVGPKDDSLAGAVSCGNIIVLRSFGKFFGLAGLRLGFALAAPPIAARLASLLGPWAVSGPALAVGPKALADAAWRERTRSRLGDAARRLDAVLLGARLEITGGTSLFRLARTPAADTLFHHLGRAGILVRVFPDHPDWLRFGLPGSASARRRLHTAMAAFQTRDGRKSCELRNRDTRA